MSSKTGRKPLIILIGFLILLNFYPGLAAGSAHYETQPSEIKELVQSPPKVPPSPVNTRAVDQAGRTLGRWIDRVGRIAAPHIGKWVNAEAFHGVKWLELLLSAALAIATLFVEWTARLALGWIIRRKAGSVSPHNWIPIILQTVTRPLSLLILVYGFYGAVSPIYFHFWSHGSNPFHAVTERMAIIGGVVAVLWFLVPDYC